jgi:hypothetical protein
VHRARERSWYAETNWGWAILRYDEVSALLKDRRFRQGNAKWPAQNGIHSGLFSDWWQETLLSLEGEDHSRIRRLLMPAFRNRTIATMRPRFQDLANELMAGPGTQHRHILLGDPQHLGDPAPPRARPRTRPVTAPYSRLSGSAASPTPQDAAQQLSEWKNRGVRQRQTARSLRTVQQKARVKELGR